MESNFKIVMDRALLDLDLLRSVDESLPRVMRHMNTAMPFVGVIDGRTVASCLVEQHKGYYDIVNLAVVSSERNKEYEREMLTYATEYLKANGARYVDIGCGNADLRLFALIQRIGFRIIGVWQDYLLNDYKIASVENSIINRDMIRFRMDLHEQSPQTIGYNASGSTC